MRAANGWVASTTACTPSRSRQADSPAAPPNPPVRTRPGIATGWRVRPASDVVTSNSARDSSRRARSAASPVPPEDEDPAPQNPSDLPAVRPCRSNTMTSTRVPPSSIARARARASRATSAARGRAAALAACNAWCAVLADSTLAHELRRAAQVQHPCGQSRHVHLATPGVEVHVSHGQLGELSEAAADGQPGHGVAAQVLEQAAREVPHVEHRGLRQAVQRPDRAFGGRAGAARDMRMAGRDRDVDAAMDGVDPGRTRIGDHDPGGAEDRESTDDSQSRVPGPLREPLAAGDRDLHDCVRADACRGRDLGDHRAHHLSRDRVDGRLADRHRQSRQSDGADPRTGAEHHPRRRRGRDAPSH